MKNGTWCLLLIGLLASCSKSVDPQNCDLNTNYVTDIAQAQEWIVGEMAG